MDNSLLDILDAQGLNDYSYQSFGTDKDSHHSYISGFYNDAFRPYRDQPIVMLEIGIFTGGSAALWSRYFTQADIVALDLLDRVHPDNRNLPRVKFFFTDAYRPGIFDPGVKFDIIIDDGPHTPLSQIQSLVYYLPHLRPGGIFVIEDVSTPELFPIFEFFVPAGYTTQRVDLRHIKGRIDDLMFVVRYPADAATAPGA